MKTTVRILCCCTLFSFFACSQKGNENDNTAITIDVSHSYSPKKMLLQDIADVEYIPLETTDELLWQGNVNSFTDRYIVNCNLKNGDVLFFDRKGKALKKINRMGGSGEEYSAYSAFLIDEEKNELFVNDRNKKKIFVYDLDGNFKRSLDYATEEGYRNMQIFDSENLIAYNSLFGEKEQNSFLIISKQTGQIVNEFTIPQTGRKVTNYHQEGNGDHVIMYVIGTYPVKTANQGFIINDISNDTIFQMNRSMELTPLLIQQPSRPTMDPERFIFHSIDSRDYLFLFCIEKKFGKGATGEPNSWNLVYDRKEKKIYGQDIQNDDFTSEKKISLIPSSTQFSTTNSNVYITILNAADLIEANENNQLKGRLKEIAKELHEEDNPVLMIARF